MNRVYIRKRGLEFDNHNFFQAYSGFTKLGFDVQYFDSTIPTKFNKFDIIVDYISGVKNALKILDVKVPNEIDYPVELNRYYGRKIWRSDLNNIITSPELYPIFIKPVNGKQFDGRLIKNFKDLIGCGSQIHPSEIWCSEPVNFVTEWRVFVRYGNVLDAKVYKGSPFTRLDESTVYSCIDDYTNIPAGCSLDFGLTDDGRTILIECNDGYSLGNYGLLDISYAKLISARWCEMVDIPDTLRYF